MHTPASRALAMRTKTVTYPGSADQIRVVRADLRPLLGGCPVADDVILCASELAANATLHSRSGLQGGTFTVRVSIELDHSVQVEVGDRGGPWTSATTDPNRHHGLDIIRALATDWGITGDRIARTIWARFDWRPHTVAR
jgi:anti-sigma regulatory factor (Ser/Thr protein kinase)